MTTLCQQISNILTHRRHARRFISKIHKLTIINKNKQYLTKIMQKRKF
ncbi:hypothetical protein NEIMUCOT_05298 [Neisseria mucosa ATCC 25996]|uniref:Uncharacterized protein n=1 Tax=Neisseria mucosa (strain ATCC 25996 / DSM 4631 / NCTC 10774 / M26) TaxID=546266 RepID=D2ZXE5_NEIM2|nr:hypothetical protein NEIMUCOT_05298 [Neisseria mucosa ATCC 25996]